MTPEQLEKKRKANREYMERKRRDAGVPVRIEYASDDERKEASRLRLKEWRNQNREAYNEQAAAYREKHRDVILERQRSGYRANPEKYREYRRQQIERNRDAINQRRRELYAQQVDTCRARAQKWYEQNREKAIELHRKWALANREYVIRKNKENYWMNHQASLDRSAMYKLSKSLGCSIDEIPVDLLNAKLAVLNVTRKVKELIK